ncbi:MAG TPA: hypothetical protein VHM19_21025 [Polyangiales bacterium]|nr:hypothetical protein [Polyangiales bacterium]
MLAPCLLLVAAVSCGDEAEPSRKHHDAGTLLFGDGSIGEAGYYLFPCDSQRVPTHEPTFTAVFQEIICTAQCANAYCHGSHTASAELDMENLDTTYRELVGAMPSRMPNADGLSGCSKSNLLRVEPGHPERSLLYLKVSGSPPCGQAMPLMGTPLTREQLTQLRTWIANGAKDDRVTGGSSADDAGH